MVLLNLPIVRLLLRGHRVLLHPALCLPLHARTHRVSGRFSAFTILYFYYSLTSCLFWCVGDGVRLSARLSAQAAGERHPAGLRCRCNGRGGRQGRLDTRLSTQAAGERHPVGLRRRRYRRRGLDTLVLQLVFYMVYSGVCIEAQAQ